jgi:N-acetylglucosaminyldiphosphoundecaprenol N-acetyl-beta-D-mannosaminyltransferase
MVDKVEVLGVNIDTYTLNNAEERIFNGLNNKERIMVFTPNSEMIMAAQKDKELMKVLNRGDIVIADGIGVVYASKILKKPLVERVAGFDLAKRIVEKLPVTDYSLYLFGGKPNIAFEAKTNLEKEYSGLNIVGINDGYFDSIKEKEIIEDINSKNPDVLFVCLGMGKQEKWIYNNFNNINAKVIMGVGGTLDVFACRVKRAPDIFCKCGLEWLYRLIKEPWRYKRMMALPKFALNVVLKGKRQG